MSATPQPAEPFATISGVRLVAEVTSVDGCFEQIANNEAIAFLFECARGPLFLFDDSKTLIAANSAGRRLMQQSGLQLLMGMTDAAVAFVETPLGSHRVVRQRISTNGDPCELVMLAETVAAETREVLRVAVATWLPTARQTDVLRGLLEGLSNKEIAETVGASFRTVEVHVTALLEKAGVDTRTRLVARARSLVASVRAAG